MANRLKTAEIRPIQTLRAQGWPQRRIARALAVDRETVARGGRAAEDPQNQPNPPIGSEGSRAPPVAGQDPPNLPLWSNGPVSRCEPFPELVRAALERGLLAQRISQNLPRGASRPVRRIAASALGVADLAEPAARAGRHGPLRQVSVE